MLIDPWVSGPGLEQPEPDGGENVVESDSKLESDRCTS